EVVVPEGRPALVHHLGLDLRIEVLGELAHDTHELALPRLQPRRVLLDGVQDVLFGLCRAVARLAGGMGRLAPRNRAPQVVELALLVGSARLGPRPFLAYRGRLRALEAIHAVQAQRMAGVDDRLDLRLAVALLALHHVAARE